jgi:hypothetical protein
MSLRSVGLTVVLAATMAAGCGAVVTSRGRVYVRVAPPPIVVETRAPAPGPGYVWIEGHHQWEGRAYAWVPGRYERAPRERAVWVPGHWSKDRHGWYWVEGRWR